MMSVWRFSKTPNSGENELRHSPSSKSSFAFIRNTSMITTKKIQCSHGNTTNSQKRDVCYSWLIFIKLASMHQSRWHILPLFSAGREFVLSLCCKNLIFVYNLFIMLIGKKKFIENAPKTSCAYRIQKRHNQKAKPILPTNSKPMTVCFPVRQSIKSTVIQISQP